MNTAPSPTDSWFDCSSPCPRIAPEWIEPLAVRQGRGGPTAPKTVG